MPGPAERAALTLYQTRRKSPKIMSRRSHNYARFAKKMKPRWVGSALRGDMRGRSRGISKSVLACIAILGGAGIGGLAAGFDPRPGPPPQPAASTGVAAIADMAPFDFRDFRLPADLA